MKALPCGLVLRGDRIEGLVTQSDPLKRRSASSYLGC